MNKMARWLLLQCMLGASHGDVAISDTEIIADKAPWVRRGQHGRAILNGVMGDYLLEQDNPLAIGMGFYAAGQRVEPGRNWGHPDSRLTSRLVILLHGLTNLETVWNFPNTISADDNYGLRLQREHGFTPFYLRYNSGLSVVKNGEAFARHLSELVEHYPVEIDEVVLVGFSMGGLLMRSAQSYAEAEGHNWLEYLTDCFYLGTPHEGSPVERAGHYASWVLRRTPKEYISHWADWADFRSRGIQDLRHGLVHHKLDFYPGCRHSFISGSIKSDSAVESASSSGRVMSRMLNRMLGDSLVQTSSAYPETAPPESRFAHLDGVRHVPLATSNRVYQQLESWIGEDREGGCLHFDPGAEVQLPAASDLAGDMTAADVLAGSLVLAGEGVCRTVDAVETMHLSISRESYRILNAIPVVGAVSAPIEQIQQSISRPIYQAVRSGGRLLGWMGKP
jgi:triacylglycerol lipase